MLKKIKVKRGSKTRTTSLLSSFSPQNTNSVSIIFLNTEKHLCILQVDIGQDIVHTYLCILGNRRRESFFLFSLKRNILSFLCFSFLWQKNWCGAGAGRGLMDATHTVKQSKPSTPSVLF